jgi:hypothetical protein
MSGRTRPTLGQGLARTMRTSATIVALAIGAAPALSQELSPIVTISGMSPFAHCSADRIGQQAGTNYPDTAIEPWIASNPADRDNLLTGWQQDRWSNGGARGLVAGYSFNRGAGWQTVLPGRVTKCEGGPYARASDPWADFSPSGAAFFMHLAFQPDRPNGSFGPNAMVVTRSLDGGITWPRRTTLIHDTDPQILNDKNSLTADPHAPGYVYAVWDRLQDFTVGAGEGDLDRVPFGAAGAHDGVSMARQRVLQLRRTARSGHQPTEVFFTGPTYFARTVNDGNSWEPARMIYDPGPNSQTIANQIVVPPSGTVIDFFTHILANGGTRIELIRSLDRGMTFSSPKLANTIATVDGIVTPDTQEFVRDGSILFDVAVDRKTGALYLVWQDVRFHGFDEVAFSMSTDGGTTWSNPVRINRTPPNANPLRRQAFIPSVEVGPGGVLVVTYYDFRNDRDDGKESTDYWAVICDPGKLDCRKETNWGIELRLTDSSFDLLHAPVAGGYFLGDYMGLVRAGKGVHAAFVVATTNNHTDLLTRRIGFASTAAGAD